MFVVCSTEAGVAVSRSVSRRPWIEVIDAGNPLSVSTAMKMLRARGIDTISCVGGRATATSLLHAGLVSDVYLTTSAISAGEPHTPFYQGPPLTVTKPVEKAGQGSEEGVRFEHLIVER